MSNVPRATRRKQACTVTQLQHKSMPRETPSTTQAEQPSQVLVTQLNPPQPLDDPNNPFIEIPAPDHRTSLLVDSIHESATSSKSDLSSDKRSNSLPTQLQAVSLNDSSIPIRCTKKRFEASDVRKFFKEVEGQQ